MAETNSGELMREMNTYLNEAMSADSDADGALPFESISDYLGDATGFSDVTADRKSTRLNSSHPTTSRMPSSA